MQPSRAPLLVFLAALVGLSCDGSRFRQNAVENAVLPAGEVHEGWYFAAGRQVSIHGTVNGDAYVAGGAVEIDGTINGILIVAGGDVRVSGTVTDRIFAAGGTVRLTGRTAKSITAAGGSVTLGREATVGENALLAGGTVQMNGTVEREARAAGSEVQMSGTVKGNADVAARRFNVFAGALVGGNLSIETDDTSGVRIEPGTVRGTVRIRLEEHPPETRILGSTVAAFWFRILFGLTLLLTALVLSFAMPRVLASTGTQLTDNPGRSILWGIVALFVTPVIVFLLCITVIGLPLGLFLLFLYLWYLYLSQLVLGAIIGSRLYGLAGKSGWPLFGPVALGLLIVQVFMMFPVVRPIVIIAGLIIGVGTLVIVTQAELAALRGPVRSAGSSTTSDRR